MTARAKATWYEEPAALGRYKVRGEGAATVVGNACWVSVAAETAFPAASSVEILTVAAA